MKKKEVVAALLIMGILPLCAENFVENYDDLNIEMVQVAGGTFSMGDKSEQVCDKDELNVHQVSVDGFFIGKYAITYAQFAKFVEETDHLTDAEVKGGSYVWNGETQKMERFEGISWRQNENGGLRDLEKDGNYPVVHVSWNDAEAFCLWLSKSTGKSYRLPTEAEWEFAARGGLQSKGYKYSGASKVKKVAWFWNNSKKKTHLVGKKLPNELGLYDMSGNVYEWCDDWYEETYPTEPQVNPRGAATGFRRVLRGGSWSCYDRYCRVANRDSGGPASGSSESGFRIVCEDK